MASKKKSENPVNGSPKGKGKRPPEPEPETKLKVDALAETIFRLADGEGFFDPKDLYTQVRDTGLAKSASIIVSNLRLQGFGREDRLRVPVSRGAQEVKQFINLAARLRRQNSDISFEKAVALLRSPVEVQETPPEPKPKIVVPPPAVKAIREETPVSPKAGRDFKALYEESKDKVLTLEGEVAAYKEMCIRLMENLKK